MKTKINVALLNRLMTVLSSPFGMRCGLLCVRVESSQFCVSFALSMLLHTNCNWLEYKCGTNVYFILKINSFLVLDNEKSFEVIDLFMEKPTRTK